MSFEKLDELKAKRTTLQEQLATVNTEIKAELDAMQARVRALQTEFGLTLDGTTKGKRHVTAETRARQSAAMKAAWASKSPEDRRAWANSILSRTRSSNGQEAVQ
jgi:predicted metal-dependent hydrolase